MQRIIGKIKSDWIFLVATLLYAVSIAILFPFLRFYVDNPDTISYISIAEKYANTDFANAVNGYWSPLISWLLALFLKAGGGEIIAFKYLQLLIGWFAIFNFVKLVHAIVHSITMRAVLSLAIVPFVLDYSLLHLTPDLLFLSVILFYLRITTEKEFFNHRHFGLIAGVLGVLMYFSKSFGFCFFLAHFTFLFLRDYFQTKEYAFKRHLRKNYLQAIVCFVCMSSIWIYLLSDKYRHFTISENAAFNLSREVAAAPGKDNKLPVLSGGLFQPVNNTAVNAWEDPGLATTITPLHIFSKPEDLATYRQVLKRNLLAIYYFDFRRQAGTLFIIIFSAFLFFGKRKRIYTDDYYFSLFTALILIYGGYALILIHARYIWVCTLFMLLLAAWLLEELMPKNKKRHVFARIFFVVTLALIGIKRPVKELLFSKDKDISASGLLNAMLNPFDAMSATYNIDRSFSEVKKELKNHIRPGSSIVSIQNPGGIRDGYTHGSLIALATGSKYFGQVSEGDSMLMQKDNLKADYLISFSDVQKVSDTLNWRPDFARMNLQLKIYRRKN
ncbi:MAG: glycosyltransferase family 39 protein [Bacteroidota bacterium]